VTQTERPNKFVLYRDLDDGYRWRLRAPQGETLAASSRAHRDKASCEAEMHALEGEYPDAEVLDATARAVAG
jgi:uncharacterized protein YegP (UPF0339 family)